MNAPAPLLPTLEVRQHNAITTARYEMSACEMDIVFYLLSLLKKEDNAGSCYRVKVTELQQLTGRQWNYQQFFDATSALRSREYIIRNEKERRTLQVGLLASAEYLHGQGIIELEVSEKMRPYLIDLKRNFTSFRLQAAFNLSSKYAKRIYQLASQWKDKPSITYPLDELKVMLHLKDPEGQQPEQYTKVSMLQRKVLDVAVAQINAHTDLRLRYELLKQGRAFESVRFFIQAQEPAQLPLLFEQPLDEAREAKARAHLLALAITDPVLVARILAAPELVNDLFGFVFKLKTGKMRAATNAGGLFLKTAGLLKK